MTNWSSSITGATLRPLIGAVPRLIEAAEAFAADEVIGYINGSEKLAIADASAASTATGQLCLRVAGSEKTTTGAVAAGEWVSVVLFGPVAGFTGLDETEEYFLSDTAGYGADAAGTVTRSLGQVLGPDKFNWMPGNNASS